MSGGRPSVAAVGLLLLSGGPLAAQDVPAPGNYRGALARADSLYQEAITLVEDARDAFERGDGVALGAAVRAYRRVMPYALVWHGRACWAADFGRRRVGRPGVAYPMQAVMGETWSGWNTASVYMAEGAEELLREVSAAALDSHAATLHAVVDEMRGCVR